MPRSTVKKTQAIAAWAIWLLLSCHGPASAFTVVRHAGGEFHGITYSNSMNAIAGSIARQSNLMEIDLVPTRDGDWHCFHDFEEVFQLTGLRARMDRLIHKWYAKVPRWAYPGDWSFPREAEVLAQVRRIDQTTGLHHCSLAALNQLSKEHPGVRFITDTKYDNHALLLVLSRLKTDAFVPQVYSLPEFRRAQQLGFKNIVYTLYKQGDFSPLQPILNDKALWKIVFPAAWACEGAPHKPPAWLNQFRGEIMVHTINDLSELCRSDVRVDGVYSDKLQQSDVGDKR